MSKRLRTAALTAAVALSVPLLLPSASPVAATPVRAAAVDPGFLTIVSHPDFLNADLGDVSASPLWKAGDPNSINDAYRTGLDTVMDQMKSEHPDAVLVIGDLVEGHWGLDVDNTGIFGPVGTESEKRAAIARAGDLYYSQWKQRFTDRGLTVYPGIGDHDIGDNPWNGSPNADFKRRSMDVYKSTWADHFTKNPDGSDVYADHPTVGDHTDTAYAKMLDPNVLLVTVDDFDRTDTDVARTVNGAQLAWLDKVLTRAQAQGVKYIIVQGHEPVLGPVRFRSSSNMHLSGRAGSAFWKTLVKHKVDLYLCGEVHDTSMLRNGGVTQIAAGGLFVKGQSSYMVGHFYPDRVRLTIKDLNTGPTDPSAAPLWATTLKRPPGSVNYTGGTTTVGTMTLTPDQSVTKATGKLFPYTLSVAMPQPPARTLTRSATWQAVSDPAGASFEYQTETAIGSGPFSTPLVGASTTDPLVEPLRDGRTVCASARAHHPVNGLTTGWSPWRCVTAPYDDRALVRHAGQVDQSHRTGYFHGTTTKLTSTGASVTGVRVSASTRLISVGARVSSTGGELSAYVGSHLVDRWSLQSTRAHRVWHRIDTQGLSGTVLLKKTAAGSVVLDGLEVRQRP
jgi:hypothetical protein